MLAGPAGAIKWSLIRHVFSCCPIHRFLTLAQEPDTAARLEAQIKVSKMLSYGFVFTILPIPGVYSLIAVILGLKARRMIKRADVELSGIVLSWWCIIVGGINLLFFLLYLISILLEKRR